MSLTEFLKNRDVAERFIKEFHKPDFDLSGDMLAKPLTRRHSWVGSAFDYLLRFIVERHNRHATVVKESWVSEDAVELMKDFEEDEAIIKRACEMMKNGKKQYKRFIKNGKVTRELVRSCLEFAQLDVYYRPGLIVNNLGEIDSVRNVEDDISDILRLSSIIPKSEFRAKKCCYLNPTFGSGSELVGGADADMIIDRTLIDVKTTKFLSFRREHLNQVIGYYILSLIGDVQGKKLNIDSLGIYYSRYGLLFRFPVEDVISDASFGSFLKWFRKRAKKEYSV